MVDSTAQITTPHLSSITVNVCKNNLHPPLVRVAVAVAIAAAATATTRAAAADASANVRAGGGGGGGAARTWAGGVGW